MLVIHQDRLLKSPPSEIIPPVFDGDAVCRSQKYDLTSPSHYFRTCCGKNGHLKIIVFLRSCSTRKIMTEGAAGSPEFAFGLPIGLFKYPVVVEKSLNAVLVLL